MSDNGHKPYVPPGTRQAQSNVVPESLKPWMARRDNETRREYDWRVNHSCYNCGTVIAEMADLALHEDRCSSQGKRRGK